SREPERFEWAQNGARFFRPGESSDESEREVEDDGGHAHGGGSHGGCSLSEIKKKRMVNDVSRTSVDEDVENGDVDMLKD
ncbi:unnamed protein product, partial [Amoebophrya sp. A25]